MKLLPGRQFEGDATLGSSLLSDSNLSKMPPGQDPSPLLLWHPDTTLPSPKEIIFLEFLFIHRLF